MQRNTINIIYFFFVCLNCRVGLASCVAIHSFISPPRNAWRSIFFPKNASSGNATSSSSSFSSTTNGDISPPPPSRRLSSSSSSTYSNVSSQKCVNIAVLGVGRIGYVHAQHIKKSISGARLSAIFDVVTSLAEKVSKELEVPVKDMRDIMQDADIHAVVICTPSDTHLDIIKMAAENGKAVLCEKPLDSNLSKVKEIKNIVDKYKTVFQTGFQRRFDPEFSEVESRVRNGEIGKPILLRLTSRNGGVPSYEYLKASGGQYMDQMIHDFDMARFLLKKTEGEVTQVYADGIATNSNVKLANDVDTSVVMLRFSSGAICVIDVSRNHPNGDESSMELLGSKGVLKFDGKKFSSVEKIDEKGEHHSMLFQSFIDRYQIAYINEMKAFTKAVQNKESVVCTAEDGMMASYLAAAATKSRMENRPVDMKEFLND